MVAPEGAAKRRKKLRDHCATCGKVYPRRRRWAYCSKQCERERDGWTDLPSVADPHEYLALDKRLETAMPWEKPAIRKRMAELECAQSQEARAILREMGREDGQRTRMGGPADGR